MKTGREILEYHLKRRLEQAQGKYAKALESCQTPLYTITNYIDELIIQSEQIKVLTEAVRMVEDAENTHEDIIKKFENRLMHHALYQGGSTREVSNVADKEKLRAYAQVYEEVKDLFPERKG